jgi:hypothetical protein
MFGWGYARDTCISLFQKEQEEKATRIYYAECLRIMLENTARISAGPYIKIKLQDILETKPVDNRTSTEIIEGIREKMK